MSTEKTMDHADTLEDRVRAMAHSLPPIDLGSTRSIQAITSFVVRERNDLVEALKHLLDALEGPSRTSLEDIEIAICAGRAALSKALGTPVSGPHD